MLIREAKAIAGTLSNPSKMPSRGTSLPPEYCGVGSELRGVKGSVCSNCYACKGRYVFPNVRDAMARRHRGLSHPLWAEAMVTLIAGRVAWFRWHDAGDLQSVQHLRAIVAVCERTPRTQHWLPTKERGIVRSFLRSGGKLPANLTIRLSMPMIGQRPDGSKLATSTVDSGKGYRCPSPSQDGRCNDCRACWDTSVRNVDYKQH